MARVQRALVGGGDHETAHAQLQACGGCYELEPLRAGRAEVRADTLATEFATAWTELEALGEPAAPLRATRLAELLSEQVAQESEVEELEGRLRRAGAFRVALNVGYEHSATLSRSLPAYGVLEVSYNLGNWRQIRADDGARTGRMRWAEARESGAHSRSARVVLQLRAELASERARFAEACCAPTWGRAGVRSTASRASACAACAITLGSTG